MVIEEALYAHLVGTAGVAALVSTRIYPQTIPQDVALPAIAYQRISGVREYSQSGPSQLAHPRFQLTCQAATYAGAKALANAVRAALSGYKGTMGGVGGVVVGGCFVVNETDGFELPGETQVVRLDVIVWHEE